MVAAASLTAALPAAADLLVTLLHSRREQNKERAKSELRCACVLVVGPLRARLRAPWHRRRRTHDEGGGALAVLLVLLAPRLVRWPRRTNRGWIEARHRRGLAQHLDAVRAGDLGAIRPRHTRLNAGVVKEHDEPQRRPLRLMCRARRGQKNS